MSDAVHPSQAAMAISGIQRNWMFALGVLTVALGLIGLAMTYALAVAVLFWSGILALLAGAGHLLDAIHHKAWRGMASHIVIGAIYLVIGVMLTAMPTTSAIWAARLIAISLMLTGLTRMAVMILMRDERAALRVILLISAVVSWALGLYIFELVAFPDPDVFATAETRSAWVSSWKWVIGLFVAIELLTEGVALIALSRSPKPALSLTRKAARRSA